MVYIVNDGRKVVTSRSGDNYFTSACIDVCLSFCFGGVESGALQNYVYAKLSPWAVVSIRESIDFDVLPSTVMESSSDVTVSARAYFP